MLQQLKQQPRDESDQGSQGNNYRPVQGLNNRVLRTNIDFEPKVCLTVFDSLHAFIAHGRFYLWGKDDPVKYNAAKFSRAWV